MYYTITGETLDGDPIYMESETLQDARDYAKQLRRKGETGAGFIDGTEARSILIKRSDTGHMTDRWDLMTKYSKHRW